MGLTFSSDMPSLSVHIHTLCIDCLGQSCCLQTQDTTEMCFVVFSIRQTFTRLLLTPTGVSNSRQQWTGVYYSRL